MLKHRKIALVGRKMTFAEAEEAEIFQWQNVPFEEKWQSLERMRNYFYNIHDKPFPEKLELVIKVVKGWS